MKPGKDFIGVGVGAFILNNKGQLFLMKRGLKSKNEIGKWTIPGGALEFGETFKNALIREIKEELGIDIEVLDLLSLTDHIIQDAKQHWVTPQYLCKIMSGEPKILEPEKCEAIGWFDIKELKFENLTLPTQNAIQAYIKK